MIKRSFPTLMTLSFYGEGEKEELQIVVKLKNTAIPDLRMKVMPNNCCIILL